MEDFNFKSCALIYNPIATKFNKDILKNAYYLLEDKFYRMDIKFCESEKAGHVIDLIKENNDRDLIITLGGDGTVGESYKAINEIEQYATYAHLSVGTTNDMATNFNLYKSNPLKSLEKLLNEGTVKNIDSLKVNDNTFAYVSAFGYLAYVPYLTNSKNKKKFGHAAYIAEAMKHITDVQHFDSTYEIDGKTYDSNFILGMISNFNESAGVVLHPYADPTDNKFEVLMLKKVTPKAFMEVFPQYLTGKIDLRKYTDFVDVIQTDNIKITFNQDNMPKYDLDNDGDKANILYDYINEEKVIKTNEISYETGKKIKILMPNGKR